jgi:aspartyl-tRNA(Asn)/glutamyl-tRNA(Gln) amidotransferase subunit C
MKVPDSATPAATTAINRRVEVELIPGNGKPAPAGAWRLAVWRLAHPFLHFRSFMPVDIDIAHVARLARLGLSDEELESYRSQLGVILEHAARVQEMDTGDLEPISHPLNLASRFRPDVVEPSLDRAEVLSQAPEVKGGYIVVPPALDSR